MSSTATAATPTGILLLAAFAAAGPHEASEYHDCPAVITYPAVDGGPRMFSGESREDVSAENVIALLGECMDNGETPRFAPGQVIEIRRAVAWDGGGRIASTAPWTTFPAPEEPAPV